MAALVVQARTGAVSRALGAMGFEVETESSRAAKALERKVQEATSSYDDVMKLTPQWQEALGNAQIREEDMTRLRDEYFAAIRLARAKLGEATTFAEANRERLGQRAALPAMIGEFEARLATLESNVEGSRIMSGFNARMREANAAADAVTQVKAQWDAVVSAPAFPDRERLVKLQDDRLVATRLARIKFEAVVSFAEANRERLVLNDGQLEALARNVSFLALSESRIPAVRIAGITRIAANREWTPAGERVEAGQIVIVWAKGQWRPSSQAPWIGPAGSSEPSAAGDLPGVRGSPLMRLLARCSGDASVYPVGEYSPMAVTKSGDLEFGANDTDPSNSEGAVEVLFLVSPAD